MKQQNNDLFLTLIIAIINLLWAYIPNQSAVIGVVLAFPLVFLTPGYLLVEILTQKQEQDGTTRLLLSIGLSLSIDILGGFLLNIAPPGLTAITWGVFFSLFTTTCVLLCIVKRRRWQVHRDPRHLRLLDFPLHYKLLLLLTICSVIFTFVYTNNSAASQKDQGFTQLWLLLDNQQPHHCTMQIGIYSSEATTTTYRIEVKENDEHAVNWSSIALAPQHKWQGQFSIATNSTHATPFHVEVNLYRQQDPGYVYRTVQLGVSSSKMTCTQK